LPLELAALALSAHHPLARWAVALLPAAALVGFGAFALLWPRWAPLSDAALARRLSGEVGLRSALVSAVQLQAQLGERASGFSEELARAHIREASRAAAGVDLRRALPATPVKRAALGAAACGMLSLALVAFAGGSIARGLRAVRSSPERAAAPVKQAEPITFDIALTYVYPAYTGLPTRTVPGTTGAVSAPAGTTVRLTTRADRDVSRAELVVSGKPEQVHALAVADHRALSGGFIVDKPGAYRFRFRGAKGEVLAEGPPIPIAVEVDAPPRVQIFSPARDVEVNPRDAVAVRYDAQDDYGLRALALVFQVGSAPEQRLPLEHLSSGARHASGTYTWNLSALALSAGDRVRYHLEAQDTDTVNGPKLGKTRTQVLRVYSEAEHHRLALARVQKLWEAMIGQLAANLEAPDRTPPATYQAAAGHPGPAAFLKDAVASKVDA